MSWAFYLGLIAFFTIVFAVFYAVAYSVILGIRDNYRRYYQKAELQWTAPSGQSTLAASRLRWLVPFALVTAWIVVHFVIQPPP